MRRSRPLALCGLALLFNLLNCCKPLAVDDPAYYCYARQIAERPLDPYGFVYAGRVPANHLLAPLVVPYWWGLGLALFGDRPFLWKLWLLPFSLLFVFALHALLRRFARGLELPLVLMTVFSPTFLPSLNLMLDVPALALSLSALAVFIRACDRRSLALAVLAGLLAGLATQTKYTGLVAPVLLLLYGRTFGRTRLGLLAGALALLVFAGWEWRIALGYGESHFLHSLRHQSKPLWTKAQLLLPLVAFLGGLAPCLALLGLTALGAGRRVVLTLGAVFAAGYVLLACVPEEWATFVREGGTGKPRFVLNHLVFGSSGLLVCAVVGAVGRRLSRRGASVSARRVDWFLLAWLGVELASYFVTSPFPAARRVMGFVVAATVLLGRLASRTCRPRRRAGLVRAVALGGVALGLCFFAVDFDNARAEKLAADQAADWARQREPGATIWYVGELGFPFYAEAAGMRRALPFASTLRPGDWLVEDPRFGIFPMETLRDRLEPAADLEVFDPLPLRTIICFHGGGTPLEHAAGPQMVIHVYRLR
jgi:hypothetical protein